MREHISVFCDQRDAPVDMLVLHCLALSGNEMLRLLEELQLSTHYILDENGELIKCVDEQKRAWHAGSGFGGEAKQI